MLMKIKDSWTPVAQACNPSYYGGRDQEDHISKPGKQFMKTYLKKTLHKKWLVEWRKVKGSCLSTKKKKKKKVKEKEKKDMEKLELFIHC
jgi:hypothetical protein